MDRLFFKGFTVYRNGSDPVYAAPHSGPSFEVSTARDDFSDTISSLCWLKSGGTLVLSTITRKRIWGIDFNRDLPPQELALRMYPEFIADKDSPAIRSFKERYAFVAKSKSDYLERERIFGDFWRTVGASGSIIVMLHRKFARIKNYPSLMDIVAYEGKGVDKEIIARVINEINNKYGENLKSLAPGYKRFLLTEAMRISSCSIKAQKEGEGKKANSEYSHWLNDDLNVLNKLAEPDALNALLSNMSPRNYVMAVKSAMQKEVLPKITLENIFNGRKALTVKSNFFNNKFLIMEAEVNAFMGYWQPELAASIIVDIINMLRGAKLYKHLGIRQTSMRDFMNI